MLFNDPANEFFTRIEAGDRKIMTLGPRGTSSYAAAERFAQRYPSDIFLFPTYERAADAVCSSQPSSALIVANAYALINRFYISHELKPIGAFFNNTPSYVLAGREESAFNVSKVTIATHPAPKHLITEFAVRSNITICDADSTHHAATMVADGEVEACLTTQTAATICGLKIISTVFPTIPMLWTVFTCKGY